MLEHVAALKKAIWKHPLAVEHQGLGHFSKHQFQHETRSRCEGWTAQNAPQYLGVLLLRDRFGRCEIVSAFTRLVHHQMIGGVNLVVQGDPRIVLATTTCWATSTKFCRQQEFLQRTAHRRRDNASPNPCGSDACFFGCGTSGFQFKQVVAKKFSPEQNFRSVFPRLCCRKYRLLKRTRRSSAVVQDGQTSQQVAWSAPFGWTR